MTIQANLVSVIIPVYNRPVLLREAVESVVLQDYRPVEIIIVDDGSTDETPDVIYSLQKEFGNAVRTKRIENSGPGVAREAGRLMSQGSFIQYLDSDDLLLPEKFSSQIAAFNAKPECGIAYGKSAYQVVGEPFEMMPCKGTGEQRARLFPYLLTARWWTTSTPLFRREVCDKAGPWLPLINEEDWEYECRIAKTGVELVWVDDFVSIQRATDSARISTGGSIEPSKLRDRCLARIEIIGHAREAGISVDQADFAYFLKGSFLVVRQAAMQNVVESRKLAQTIYILKPALKVRLYQVLSFTLGLRRAAMLSEWGYHLLKPKASQV